QNQHAGFVAYRFQALFHLFIVHFSHLFLAMGLLYKQSLMYARGHFDSLIIFITKKPPPMTGAVPACRES
ncbi:hypothetical protein RLK21_00415, partial [Streptococcus pneumoniae]|nr:hypothetical protein [Streptococcus pneumoniae]